MADVPERDVRTPRAVQWPKNGGMSRDATCNDKTFWKKSEVSKKPGPWTGLFCSTASWCRRVRDCAWHPHWRGVPRRVGVAFQLVAGRRRTPEAMAPSGGATRAREYGSRRVTYDEDEYNFEEEYGRLSDDDAYDPMQHVQDDLRKTMAHAKSARSTKEKRRPVKEVSTLNNALQAMYEDEVAFFDEEQVVKDAASYRFRDDDSAEDTSGGIETSNSVFTLAEKRQGALEGLRAKARFKHATTYAQNDVKQKLIVDYGTTDASEWVPHVFSDGGGSVAWFKSRDAMTTEERIAADIAADRAEGISGISGTVRTVRVTKEDLPKNIEVESGADVERVLRVTKRAEVLVRKIDDDAEQTGQGDVLTQGLNQELPTQPRRRGIRAAGRRVVMSNTLKKEGESKKQSTHTYENIFPPGGVRAPRGLPHEPPDTRGKTRVVERPIACGVNGEIVETTAGDVDFNRRPEESDLVVQETTQTRETTSNFVTMDEHGNVIGHGETLRENKRTVADADGNELEVDVNDDDDHGDIPNEDTDQESFDAMKLTDGQVDIVVELLRDKHGMEVTSEKLRELLSLIKTKKKYYGVDADAWQEKGDEQTAAEEDGSIAALLGNLLTGLFAEEKPGPPKPRPKFSANVVFDKQLDPVVEARLRASSAGASGLLARRDAKPGASRGAWRSARRATDLGASRDPRGDFLCTTVMSAMERQHIIDGETKASIDRAKKLADLKPNKWKVLGAFGVFTGTMTEAARLAKEYREEEEAEYRLPNPKPKPKPKPQQKTMTERRKLVDAKGNVVEVMEEKKVTLDNSNSSKFESMADMIKKREAQDLAEGRPRCICYDAQSEPVVSGGMGGKKTRGFGGMGGRKKRTALAKTVKNCPVHFPFGDKPIKTVPTKPPNKTHAVSDDTKTSEPAARNDDAGYVLYETSQYFYLASHDHTRSKWRLAKIARRADTLEVDEHGLVYDREQLKELMSAVHKVSLFICFIPLLFAHCPDYCTLKIAHTKD